MPLPASDIGDEHPAVSDQLRDELLPRVKALVAARRMVAAAPPRTVAPVRVTTTPEVLVVACSTGGPDALSTVLAELP